MSVITELGTVSVLRVVSVPASIDAVSTSDWTRLVAALADMTDAVDRLIAEHQPDSQGRCVACTTPGRGTSRLPWPCAIAQLAEAARRHTEET